MNKLPNGTLEIIKDLLYSEYSIRKIAAHCQVSRTTVSKYRKTLGIEFCECGKKSSHLGLCIPRVRKKNEWNKLKSPTTFPWWVIPPISPPIEKED